MILTKKAFENIKPLELWINFLLAGFIIFQPLSKTDTGHFAAAIWITGLVMIFVNANFRTISRKEAGMIFFAILFFVVSLLSSFFSIYPIESISTFKNIIPFLVFPFVYLLLSNASINERNLLIIFILGSISYLILLIEHKGGRMSGQENAVTFGNGALLFSVITGYLALTNNKLLLKLIGLTSAAIYFYASIQSGTRGSYLAIPFIVTFLLFLPGKKVKILSLTLLVIFAIIFTQTNVYKRLYNSTIGMVNYYLIDAEAEEPHSASERIEMWKTAWCHFKHYPVLGVGHKNFQNALQSELNDCETHSSRKNYIQSHSVYFNTLSTTGIAGLLSLILFFCFAILTSKEKGETQFRLLSLSLICMLSYALTVDLFFQKFLSERHLIIIAIALTLCKKSAEKNEY